MEETEDRGLRISVAISVGVIGLTMTELERMRSESVRFFMRSFTFREGTTERAA
jgi:hypothetical protein